MRYSHQVSGLKRIHFLGQAQRSAGATPARAVSMCWPLFSYILERCDETETIGLSPSSPCGLVAFRTFNSATHFKLSLLSNQGSCKADTDFSEFFEFGFKKERLETMDEALL